MRDPLLVVIKKDDANEMAKPQIDEVAKEVIADDDWSSESSQGFREISQNTPELSTRRQEASNITKSGNVRGSTKRIESTRNEAGLKVPKENFVKLTPEKGASVYKDTVPKPYNTEVIESADYLIITLNASHRRKIPRLRTSTTKAVPKASKSSAQVPKVNPKDSVLLSRNTVTIPTSKSSKDISITVLPIVLHGVAKASEKYDETPNEDFYTELRDFNKPTRWNKNTQRYQHSITNIPHSKKSSEFYPIKFATFLIRVPVSKPKTELSAQNSSKTNTMRSVENEERRIEAPKITDVNKRIDILESRSSEISQDSSIIASSANQKPDPFTVNPIKFRKELRALCRSKSHEEPIIVRKKESEKLAKSGAIPKSPASLKVKKVRKSSLTGEDGEVSETRATRKRERDSLQLDNRSETINVTSAHENAWTINRALPVPCAVPENYELQFSETDFEKLSFQTGVLSEVRALPESSDLTEPDGALTETDGALTEPDGAHTEPDAALTEPDAALTEPDAALTEPDAALTEPDAALTEPDAALTETDAAFQETRNNTATDAKTFQFRDIPVIAYVSQSTTNQRKMNLKKHLKNKDPLGYHYKKLKYYKRHESSRQQNLLDKIVFDLPQIDAAMLDAQILTFRIDTLRQENCESEESLRNRNLKMKLLMNRLIRKTMKIDSLYQSIRCNITMYTLETNASNSKANKRLGKVLKFYCEAKEFAQILRENLVLL